MYTETFHEIDSFVAGTSEAVYLRKVDSLLIIRPDRVKHLNSTGFEMLQSLYEKKAGAADTVEFIHKKYGTGKELIVKDLTEMIKSLNAIINDDYSNPAKISTVQYKPENTNYPVQSEIAITYKCQNRCDFCDTSYPSRGSGLKEMNTQEIKKVIDKIHDEAKIPEISFTGGEPTMRKDLPELIEYAAKKGMRTNLITNGIKSSDKELVKKLSGAGLHFAQVSLESHDELMHNRITGNIEAYKNTIAGIHNLKKAGIETQTNTTINRWNRNHLTTLVKFIKDEFNAEYLSMNIATEAGTANDNENIHIGYSSINGIIKPVLDYCEKIGVKLAWYSHTPYCMFNPVEHNMESKSCACLSGLLSINPAGEIIPCSGFNRSIGNVLKNSFTSIWNSDEALYFHEKQYIPAVCKKCSMKIICKGACPLYLENAGSFKEIEKINKRRPFIGNFFWSLENRIKLK